MPPMVFPPGRGFLSSSAAFCSFCWWWATPRWARAFNRQREPIRAMGLVFRPGWQREFGLGAALGWGMLLASILPLVLSGGLIITFWASSAPVRNSRDRSAGARRGFAGRGSRFPRLSLPALDRSHGANVGHRRFLLRIRRLAHVQSRRQPRQLSHHRSSAAGCYRWPICAPARFGSAGVGTLPGMRACVLSLGCR